MTTFHRNVDKNQKEIVKQLRDMGCTVLLLHRLGVGAPDILVGYGRRNYLVELKKDRKMKLSEVQKAWHSVWEGQVLVASTLGEIWEMITKDLQLTNLSESKERMPIM